MEGLSATRMSNLRLLFRGILGSFDLLLLVHGIVAFFVLYLCDVHTYDAKLKFRSRFPGLVDGSMNLCDHSDE